MKEKIQNNLRLLRLLHGDLPQKYIAFKIQVSQAAYSKMELGELTPSKKVLNNICVFYCLENYEIIFLQKEEFKKRLFHNPISIEYKTKDNVMIEVENLKRKLKVMLNSMKVF
jgi:transcriptional regulator with XRE-family HTH domain